MSRNFQCLSKKFSHNSAKGTKFNAGFGRPVVLNPSRLFSMSVPFGLCSSKPTLLASGTNNPVTEKLKDYKLFRPSAFINGQWLTTSDYKSFDVNDPSESATFTSVPDLGANEANFAIQSAHAAFTGLEWGNSTVRYRHDLLMKLYKSMLDNKSDLASIITKENGKPFEESLAEVKYAAGFVEWFAEESLRIYGDVIPSPVKNTRYHVIHQPIGVAGIITPWNFPIAMITRKMTRSV